MHDVMQGHSNVKVEKRVLTATVEVQAPEIESLKAENEILYRSLENEESGSGTDRKGHKIGDITRELRFRQIETGNKFLRSVPTYCATDMKVLYILKILVKEQWSRLAEDESCNRVIESFGGEVFALHSDSIRRFENITV